ncbi:MAG: IclR family transcriptional regulator [Paracoccus sp. (in: a-proteobacteria)]|nr:IclR family transcriptional regulator [Paracoccus sp. (in: a-proteobacteria)]
MNDDKAADEPVQTNLRPLRILQAVAAAGAPVTAAEIGELLNLPRPTMHRLFLTLEADGWLMRDLSGRGFVAGYGLRRMAANTLSGPGLRRERLMILTTLAREIGETCNIAMPEGNSMTYIDRVETEWPLRIRLPIGSSVPLHCTAAGKMYLSTLAPSLLTRVLGRLLLHAETPHSITDADTLRAEIERTRKRGFSEDNGEMIAGMIALAVPVRDNLGRFLATLSFHAPVQRLTLPDAHRHLPRLRLAAAELGENAAGTAPSDDTP